MTDSNKFENKNNEQKEQIINCETHGIQDINWGDPVEEVISKEGGVQKTYAFSSSMMFAGKKILLNATKEYTQKADGSAQVYLKLVYGADGGEGRLELEIFINSDGSLRTCIEKYDSEEDLPKGFGAIMYDKINSFFMHLAKNDDVGFQKEEEEREYVHEVNRVPRSEAGKETLKRETWYKVFGKYLAEHNYMNQGGDKWEKLYLKIPEFSDLSLLDFDWEDGAVFDGEGDDVRVRPSKFREKILVGSADSFLEGESKKHYKITSEGRELIKEEVVFRIDQAGGSMIASLEIDGGKVYNQISTEGEVDEYYVDMLKEKISHYVKYKAIRDKQDYEFEGEVIKGTSKWKIVEEFLLDNNVRMGKE